MIVVFSPSLSHPRYIILRERERERDMKKEVWDKKTRTSFVLQNAIIRKKNNIAFTSHCNIIQQSLLSSHNWKWQARAREEKKHAQKNVYFAAVACFLHFFLSCAQVAGRFWEKCIKFYCLPSFFLRSRSFVYFSLLVQWVESSERERNKARKRERERKNYSTAAAAAAKLFLGRRFRRGEWGGKRTSERGECKIKDEWMGIERERERERWTKTRSTKIYFMPFRCALFSKLGNSRPGLLDLHLTRIKYFFLLSRSLLARCDVCFMHWILARSNRIFYMSGCGHNLDDVGTWIMGTTWI